MTHAPLRRPHPLLGHRGQVAPLMALVLLLIGAVCLALVRVGAAATERAQARTAADAGALAGALAGRPAATVAAAANGGSLVGYREVAGVATADVTVGRARASASARPDSSAGPGSGPVPEVADRLAPGMRASLARAAQLLGHRVAVVAEGHAGGPGAELHRRGLAVDVDGAVAARLAEVARSAGLCQPYPEAHPTHFQLCPVAGAGRPDR